jgi:hypothetical protein
LRIARIEEPHFFQHVRTTAGDVLCFEVGRQTDKEARSVCGTVFAILLEVFDKGSDKPVAKDAVAVHQASGSGLGVLLGIGNRGDERVVVHGVSSIGRQRP